jgi:hypothetical protein
MEPLLPPPKVRSSRYPGRKPLDNRAVLTGILFILQTGLRAQSLENPHGPLPHRAMQKRGIILALPVEFLKITICTPDNRLSVILHGTTALVLKRQVFR